MYRTMRQERTHSRGMRELANVIVGFLEWLWQLQELPSGRRQTSHSSSKGQVKRSKELKSGQLLFSPWENNGAALPCKLFPGMWRTRKWLWTFNMIYWGQTVFGQLLWQLCHELVGSRNRQEKMMSFTSPWARLLTWSHIVSLYTIWRVVD